MNFFAAQEEARKASRKLVLWFVLCVLAVIALVYTVLAISMIAAGSGSSVDQSVKPPPGFWQAELFFFTFVVVGGLILMGSLWKLARLSGGGAVIARDLGGRQIEPSTRDPKERQLLNVVEEMSIASGTPMPEAWVMDQESSINAFAAGTDPSNAVIGVTRGTLDTLTRSELQGVIAHEYSHIINGDMKLNMRLTGWIFGLVMVAMLGRLLLQSLRFMRGSRDSKAGGVVLAIVLLGAAVWIIGSIGVLFSRMIQAAISRQREFLADASAVQFTRLPDGISGALKKIGGIAEHGKIEAANAAEARHMFFASSSLSSMLATHPPLDERIRAIEPNWDGEMLVPEPEPAHQESATNQPKGASTPPPIPGTEVIQDAMGPAGAIPGMGGGMLGAMIAGAAIAEEESQTPSTELAQGIIYGLLIPIDDQKTGGDILSKQGYDENFVKWAMEASTEYHQASSGQKLSVIDTSLPWLRQMTHDQGRLMVSTIQLLVEADGQIDLFEFMLMQVSKRHIEIGLGLRQPPSIRFKKIGQLEIGVANLLAIFASTSGDPDALKPAQTEYAEHTGRALPTMEMDFARATQDLEFMDASTPIVKKQILRLCWLTANQDGEINEHEGELLRAVAEALGCALPRGDDRFADLS